MSIISLSGKISSGKDTVGQIIQYLVSDMCIIDKFTYNEWLNYGKMDYKSEHYQIKKFADKLKDIVCLLLNCTREQLEDDNFKNKELGEEWWYYRRYIGNDHKAKPYYEFISLSDYNNIKEDSKKFLSLYKLTPRLLLQLLGTDCGRNIIHPNIWCTSLMSEYKPENKGLVFPKENYLNINSKATYLEYPNWIITDTRFPNELQAVKQKNGITIRVNRGSMSMVELANQHESETALDNATFDYIIENDTTIEYLIEKVRLILVNEKIL